MKDRIQQIIDYKGISAGDLAELLGVQRSNISHILNGRNKPGAVFIEKLLQAFPDINARWLLTGEGSIQSEGSIDQTKNAPLITEEVQEKQKFIPPAATPDLKSKVSLPQKNIEKIVLLYSDGTFTYYNQI